MAKDSIDEIRDRKLEELKRSLDHDNGSDTETKVPTEPIVVDSQSTFESTVSEYEVVLVDFHADWCGPCKMMEPTIEDIASRDDVVVAKVDVDANQTLANQFNVRGVPTLLVFEDGTQVEQLVGLQQADKLNQIIDRHTA